MKRKRIAKLLVFVLVLGSILPMGYMVFSATSNYIAKLIPETEKTEVEKNPKIIKEGERSESEPAIGLPPEKKPLVVTKEIENKITELDSVNSARNIKNYKDTLNALKATEKLQKKMEDMLVKGHQVPDVLTAYEFLYDNIGTLDELEALLNKKKGSKEWAAIFKEYNANKKEFTPRSFKSGELESLMEANNLTPDDIMMADRISQKGVATFDELVGRLIKGWDWQDINSEFGVINTSGSFPKVAVNKEELDKYMNSTSLTRQQIVKGFILAEKVGKPHDEVINKLKAGNKEEDIIAQYYSEKYGK